MAQSSPKMHFSELQILKFSRSHTLPTIPYPPLHAFGAEAPYYITLMATPFHSPSTAKFGENPGPSSAHYVSGR